MAETSLEDKCQRQRTNVNDAVKLAVLGTPGVGKTSFVYRYVEGEVPEKEKLVKNEERTFKKEVKVPNEQNRSVEVEISDPSDGLDLPDDLIHFDVEKCNAVVLAFSTTDLKALPNWHAMARERCAASIAMVLVETKVDLMESSVLESDAVEALAASLRLRLYRVSAMLDFNVHEAVAYLVRKCVQTDTARIDSATSLFHVNAADKAFSRAIPRPVSKKSEPCRGSSGGQSAKKDQLVTDLDKELLSNNGQFDNNPIKSNKSALSRAKQRSEKCSLM